MSSNLYLKQAVRLALGSAGAAASMGLGSVAGAGPADTTATVPADTASSDVTLSEVVVTGSRIRRVDAETANPIVTIDQKTIAESGITQIGDLVQRIPSISGNATNPSVNNGGGYAESNIELRGLNAKRTLILVNGHRVGFVGTTSDATDMNLIPFNLIDHVEVLKEGAGAIYGSDAIAGVVNFITRKDVEGLELTGQYGETTHADGKNGQFGMLFGHSGDKGSVYVGGNYFKQDLVGAGRREFSKYALYLYGNTSGTFQGGSSRVPTGRIYDNPLGLLGSNGKPCASVTRNANASGAALTDYHCYSSPADDFNYQPLNLLTTPVERSSMFGKANYKINDYVEAYSSVTYTHSHFGYQAAPLPFDSLNDNIVISKNNIYNPFGSDFGGNAGANPDFTLRTFLFGQRESDTTADGADFNGGVRGDLFNTGWKWDANTTYSRLQQHANYSGYYFASKLNAAAGPSFLLNGVPTCGTGPTSIVSGCTPINLFNQYANAPSALSGLSANYNLDYVYTYKAVDVDFNGKVLALPAGDLQAAVGFEYNDRRGNSVADQVVQALPPLYVGCGLSQETCTGNVIGAYNSKQEYLELFAPILKDMPFVHSLNVDAGVRHNEYSLFSSSTKSDFKVEYRPIRDLLLRGTFSQVLRVPTINDIAAAPLNTSVTFNDPCNKLTQAKVNANPNLALACQGVPRDGTFQEPNGQITGLNTSNPALKPETGKVKTGGFVYEPSYVPGFSVEVDYWDYHIDGLITTLDANYSIDQCVATGSPTFCGLVHRYPFIAGNTNSGLVQVFVNPSYNLGSLDTSGVDVSLKYALRNTPIGTFTAELDWTHTNNYTNQPAPGAAPQEIAGTYNKQFGNYTKNRALGLFGWNWLGAEALITERYIGSLNITNPCMSGVTSTGAPCPPYYIGSVLYTDITLGYAFPTNTHLQAGVRNLSDKQPPIFYQNNVTNANTDVETYDTLGRQWFVGFSQKF